MPTEGVHAEADADGGGDDGVISLLLLPLHRLRIMLEEVVIQYDTDAHEQFCIDAFALEYVVHVRSVAKQLSCKPTDGAFLTAQFFFNEFSNM